MINFKQNSTFLSDFCRQTSPILSPFHSWRHEDVHIHVNLGGSIENSPFEKRHGVLHGTMSFNKFFLFTMPPGIQPLVAAEIYRIVLKRSLDSTRRVCLGHFRGWHSRHTRTPHRWQSRHRIVPVLTGLNPPDSHSMWYLVGIWIRATDSPGGHTSMYEMCVFFWWVYIEIETCPLSVL